MDGGSKLDKWVKVKNKRPHSRLKSIVVLSYVKVKQGKRFELQTLLQYIEKHRIRDGNSS